MNVYFIASKQRLKIGHATDPKKRLSSMQTGCPVKLRLLGFAKGGPDTEKRLHDRLRPHHTHGEWFDEVVLRCVETLMSWGIAPDVIIDAVMHTGDEGNEDYVRAKAEVVRRLCLSFA